MTEYYNHETFLVFLGGICSVLLAVVIVFGKQEHKRSIKRTDLELRAKEQNENLSAENIEAKLNDNYETRRLDFLEKLTQWGLQPLFIISFMNLFSKPNALEVGMTFILILFTILHELWSSVIYSRKVWYQLILAALWVAMFVMISYRTNHAKGQTSPHNPEMEQRGE